MNKKMSLIALLFSILAAIVLTACGGQKEEVVADGGVPTELDFYVYYADSNIPIVDRAMEILKEKYPDLTVNIEHRIDSDGAVLKTRAAVGELPDVFECVGQLTDIFRDSGDILPLNDLMEERAYTETFYETALDGKLDADGNYYAITIDAPQAALMYYNIELFDRLNLEPPKNYAEMKNVVTTLVANDIIPLALFAQQKWPGLQMYDMAVIGQGQTGGLTALQDGTGNITDPEYLEAAEKLSELVSLGLLGKGALNTNASQAFELVETGAAGMLVNGSWFFTDAIAGGYAENIGYFEYNPFADAADAEDIKGHMSGGRGEKGGYAVNANGNYVEFSKQWMIDYLEARAVAEAELGKATTLRNPPEPKEARSAGYQHYIDSIPDFKSTSYYEWGLANKNLIVVLEDTTELLLIGSYSPEQYIDDLDASIEDILSE